MTRHQEYYLQLRQISKIYPGKIPVTALKEINLDLRPGERLAVLGKSGSGKSTLLNLLALIDRPTGGRLLVHNRDSSSFTSREATLFRRREVGFVFQFFNLIPTLTLRDNIMLPLERLGGHHDRDFFTFLVSRAGIAQRLDNYPEEVAGGEQQRAAVVRALVKKPRLLLADEPTGNLDHETGRQIVSLMAEICRQQQTTMVMVTHSLEAAAICGRTVHIRDGHLVETPPAGENGGPAP